MSLKNDLNNGDIIELDKEVGKVIGKSNNGFTFVRKDKLGTTETFYKWSDLEVEEETEETDEEADEEIEED